MRKYKILPPFFLIVFLFICCDKEKKPDTPDNAEISYDEFVNYKILDDLVSKIDSHQFGGAVHSLIIVKNDLVVFERYFNGSYSGLKQPLYSVTKSFISALVGICLQKGYIANIDMRVLDFFPEYHNIIANYDSSKEDITIRNLLTMTAGFSWNEGSTSYDNPNNDLNKFFQSQSPDMIKLGQLYLKKGRWNNVQVIPESWVEESIKPHFRIDHWHDYGYHWWRYGKTKLEPILFQYVLKAF